MRGLDSPDVLLVDYRMKHYLLTATALALLISCAGLPSSIGTNDSLVIGSFTLDFPKGFFDISRTSIESGVQLNFRDVTDGKNFSIRTRKGHFWFIAAGGHDYELVSFELLKSTGGDYYNIGTRDIGITFPTEQGKVIYPGDFRCIFSLPLNSTWIARPFGEPDYHVAIQPESGTRIDYVYRYSTAPRQWDDQTLRDFMKGLDPASPWLDREIIEVGK